MPDERARGDGVRGGSSVGLMLEEPTAAAPDAAEDLEMVFFTEISNFHMALQEGDESSPSAGTGERIIGHLAKLRGMLTDVKGDADAQALRREMHGACIAKAREWVESRTNHLVAEFHLRWHEDADLLAVDTTLRESVRLVSDAECELGALPVSHEVLGACEQQLRATLSKHVRRANRHELRMLYGDFCGWASRAELRQLCLDKYREQGARVLGASSHARVQSSAARACCAASSASAPLGTRCTAHWSSRALRVRACTCATCRACVCVCVCAWQWTSTYRRRLWRRR